MNEVVSESTQKWRIRKVKFISVLQILIFSFKFQLIVDQWFVDNSDCPNRFNQEAPATNKKKLFFMHTLPFCYPLRKVFYYFVFWDEATQIYDVTRAENRIHYYSKGPAIRHRSNTNIDIKGSQRLKTATRAIRCRSKTKTAKGRKDLRLQRELQARKIMQRRETLPD